MGARGVLCAQRSRRRGNSQRRRADAIAQQPVSNFISKKLCTLEIDLEITTSLPDKAYRPIQPPISKSPNIFCFRRHSSVPHGTGLRLIEPTPIRLLESLTNLARTAHAAKRYEFCGNQKRGGNSGGNSATLHKQHPYTTGLTSNYFIPALAPDRHRSIARNVPMLTTRRRLSGEERARRRPPQSSPA